MQPEMSIKELRQCLRKWDGDLESLLVDWKGSLGQRVYDIEDLPIRIPDTGQVVGTLTQGKAIWAQPLIESWRLRRHYQAHPESLIRDIENVPVEPIPDA